jgi:hypothetical protein
MESIGNQTIRKYPFVKFDNIKFIVRKGRCAKAYRKIIHLNNGPLNTQLVNNFKENYPLFQ